MVRPVNVTAPFTRLSGVALTVDVGAGAIAIEIESLDATALPPVSIKRICGGDVNATPLVGVVVEPATSTRALAAPAERVIDELVTADVASVTPPPEKVKVRV
jgi:hypothetical protein